MPAYLRDSLTSPRSPSVVSEARVSKLHTRARCVCALSIQRLEGRRWRLRRMRANGYGNSYVVDHIKFCGPPRYVALAIGWQNRPTWPCAQRHIILYQRLCRNCINEASFFQCFEGTAPWTSQVASARVYCWEFGVYRHVRFGGCNVSLGVRVPLAP